ncbi:GNAT family N-acetyltransferase [Asticcacaulis sp. EMRT-3]|uniref:GNAT family N-acetyltransferase n=1 Tax=Asticcacaulis sp. EMRT-3 TaxID=3040349 RepID=UPI0024AF7148|nr:GNAT family N-acetyltransferase [Asticcacaulis sp. EMRT-3]MDI7774304.1 GNAT family N-acetyltransferase [Asticcacaulis sp. EMRT-3]
MHTDDQQLSSPGGRFELSEDGHTAFADYRLDGATLYIDYVEAPPALRGTGAAGRLMADLMQRARAEDLKVVPICDYAAVWIKRHPA